MATVTIYFLNTAASAPNWFGRVQDGGSAPAGALGNGWGVGKVAVTTPYWRGRFGASSNATAAQAASYIDAAVRPVQGTGATNTTAGDSFRSDNPLSGTFAAGNWNFTFGMRTQAATTVGRIRLHVWASVNADGTGTVRKLNSSTLAGTIVTMSTTTTTYNSTVTWAAPSVVLANEYLFTQVEWQETTAGTSNSCTAQFYQASFVTTNWVPDPATGTLAETEDPDVVDLDGLVGLIGALADSEDPDTASFDGEVITYAPNTGVLGVIDGGAYELLLHMDGADASTSFPDSGGMAHTVTAHGAAQVDTQSVFAGQALQLAGANDYLSLDTGDYVFGVGDFCVDIRVRVSSPSEYVVLYDGGSTGFKLSYDSALIFESAAGTITGSAFSANTNYHVALTRAAGMTRLWRDGAQQGSTLVDPTDYGAAGAPRVGGALPRGVLAATEIVSDTAASTGTVVWLTVLAAPEAADVAAFAGTVRWLGVLGATEAADVSAITGLVSVVAAITATEAADAAVFSGKVERLAVLGATEAADVSAFTALGSAFGTLVTTEGVDTASFSSPGPMTGTLAATEANDVAAFSGVVTWFGTMAVTEVADAAVFTGSVRWFGTLAATEAVADTAAFTGTSSKPTADSTLYTADSTVLTADSD